MKYIFDYITIIYSLINTSFDDILQFLVNSPFVIIYASG